MSVRTGFGSDIDDAKEIKLSIARFPALQHVTLYSGTGPFGPPTDFMESMNDMQKLLLFLGIAPPNASGGWETNNARTMALFRSLSAVRQPLRSMTLHGMNWDFLSGCTKSEIKQLHLQIKQLHILNVAIKVPLDEDSDMVPRHIDSFRCIKRAANLMGEFLASATNLETLTLTFLQVDRQQSIDLRDVGSFPIEVHRLVIEGIIAQNAHSPAWPNLKNLALNNITFEYPDTLERLIQSSSKSLKRLRMSNIHLMLGNWLCTLRLIPNLFPTHNLEKFILSHEITSDYEHWDVKPRERGSSCPENCLRDKIEQWVEDGGDKCGRPFPLLPEYVPQCQMHFYPSPTRLRELREMTLQHLRAGDRSFVWRYDYLLESTVFNVDRYCPPDCCYRFSSHEESPMDIIEGACFDIAEVYDDYHFQNNNPFRYAIEDLEYIGLSSQEIGWRGMFEFDPKVDCRFMCNMREGLAKMVTST